MAVIGCAAVTAYAASAVIGVTAVAADAASAIGRAAACAARTTIAGVGIAAVAAIAALACVGIHRVAAMTAVAAGDAAAPLDGCRLAVVDRNAVAAEAAVAGGSSIDIRVSAVTAVAAGDAAVACHDDRNGAFDARTAVAAVKRTGHAGIGGCAVRAVAADDLRAAAHRDFSVFGDLALIFDRTVERIDARRAVGICGDAVAALDGAVGHGQVGAGVLVPAGLHKAQTGSRLGRNAMGVQVQRHAPPSVGNLHGAGHVLFQYGHIVAARAHRDDDIAVFSLLVLAALWIVHGGFVRVFECVSDVLGVYQPCRGGHDGAHGDGNGSGFRHAVRIADGDLRMTGRQRRIGGGRKRIFAVL